MCGPNRFLRVDFTYSKYNMYLSVATPPPGPLPVTLNLLRPFSAQVWAATAAAGAAAAATAVLFALAATAAGPAETAAVWRRRWARQREQE